MMILDLGMETEMEMERKMEMDWIQREYPTGRVVWKLLRGWVRHGLTQYTGFCNPVVALQQFSGSGFGPDSLEVVVLILDGRTYLTAVHIRRPCIERYYSGNASGGKPTGFQKPEGCVTDHALFLC